MAKCRYCGQHAGLFSTAHKSCIEKYENSKCDSPKGITPIDVQMAEWLPKSKVSLSEALKLFVENLGIQIITDSKLPNSLSDIVDFSECKAAKSVLRELIYNNSLNVIKNESDVEKQLYHFQIISQKAESDFGFNPTVVKYVIDAIKFSLGINVDNNSFDEDEDNITTQPILPTPISAPIGNNSHLEFWGIPLGSSVGTFDGLFKTKGYGLSNYNKPEEKKIHYNAYGRTEMFIGYGSGITIYESPYTGLVYKVEVCLSKMITKSMLIYEEIYPLLIQKYGKPYKDNNIIKSGPQKDKGVVFKIPEGLVSLTFGDYHTGDFSLYLRYEDNETMKAIAHELPMYEEEIRRKKEREQQDYKNKLISDL